jgi:phosphate transport system protein
MRKCKNLRNHELEMGSFVEQQIGRATDALKMVDDSEAEAVVRNDKNINGLQVSIDEECAHILLRRQLASSDLRMVVAVIKAITDIEGVGDEAKRIAKMAIDISEQGGVFHNRYIGITYLSEHVIRMVHNVLDVFARLDAEAAFDVVRNDEKTDAEYQSIIRQMHTCMIEDPGTISESLDIMQSARALERIGDHAMNIGEYVIYLIIGKDIRHVSIKDAERDVVP